MTLKYKTELDILKMYFAKMKFLGRGFQLLEHEQDRETDETEHITTATSVGGTEYVATAQPRLNTDSVLSCL